MSDTYKNYVAGKSAEDILANASTANSNQSPYLQIAAQIRSNQELIQTLEQASRDSKSVARRLVALTLALVVVGLLQVCATVYSAASAKPMSSKGRMVFVRHGFKGPPDVKRSDAKDGVLDAEWPHSHTDYTAGGKVHLWCQGNDAYIGIYREKPDLEKHQREGWPRGRDAKDDIEERVSIATNSQRVIIEGIDGQTFYCRQDWLMNELGH